MDDRSPLICDLFEDSLMASGLLLLLLLVLLYMQLITNATATLSNYVQMTRGRKYAYLT